MKTAVAVVVGLVVGAAVMWGFNAYLNRAREIDQAYVSKLKDGSLTDRLEFMAREYRDGAKERRSGVVYDQLRELNLINASREIKRLLNLSGLKPSY